MKRMLVRGLLLALGWLPAVWWAAGNAPAQSPAVSLGLPRAVTPAAENSVQSPGIQRVIYRGVSSSPDYFPASAVPQELPLASDEGSGFAIQRVGLSAPMPSDPATTPQGDSVMQGTPGVMVESVPSDPFMAGMEGGEIIDGMGSAAGAWTLYGSAEYLLWGIKDDATPPLLTTISDISPAARRGNSGSLGFADTIVLRTGAVDRDLQSGMRFTAGALFPGCQKTWGVEGSFFMLLQRNQNQVFSSDQFPFLARPFFQVNPGGGGPMEFRQLVANPNFTTGNFTITAPSQLWGTELNARCCACSGCNWGVDYLAGVRYLNLDEAILMQENITRGNIDPFPNSFVRVRDQFRTENDFYGGQVGLVGFWRSGRWSVEGRGKLAAGVTHQTIRIAGDQLIVPNNGSAPTSVQGGLLALPGANIGTFTQNRFAVVPEIGVNVGYWLTDNIRIFGGYNFLYWSSVARPGDQIDRNLDRLRIPNFSAGGAMPIGVARPTVPLATTDFWAQGVSTGIEFRW